MKTNNMAKIIDILTKDERLRLKALKDVLNNQIELNKQIKKDGTKTKK
jgi:hypothetical protein